MNSSFKSAMLAAAQLTAAGNLNAATATIQRALAGEVPVASAPMPAEAGPESTTSPQFPASFRSTTFASSSAAARRAFAAGRAWQHHPIDDVIDVDASWLADQDAGTQSATPRAQTFGAERTESERTESERTESAKGRDDAGPGSMLAGVFGIASGRREYLLYLPPVSAAATAGLSLVVMLHGCTQTPADFAAGTAMNALADRHGFLVLYPGQSKTANQSSCWNWFNPRDQMADSGEPSIIAAMVQDTLARYRLDRRRVYAAGLSAGGAMVAILANAYPDLFAAVAVHSGLPHGAAHDLPSALSAMKRGAASSASATGESRQAANSKPVPTIVFHGRQDRTVHPSNARHIVDAALAAWPEGALIAQQEAGRSAGGRSYARTVYVDAAGKPMVEQWEVQGAGHAWSGGSSAGSYTDPRGPDASAAMMAFFLAH